MELHKLINNAMTAIQTTPMQAAPVNIEAWAKWAKLETFGEKALEEMLEAVARFVLEVRAGKDPRWLSLVGTSGSGKTHLAERIWRWWLNGPRWYESPQGANLVHSGQFCLWPKFVNEMQKGDFGRDEDLCSDMFVILDDIGAEQDRSGFSKGKLARIAEERLGRWTVITSNLSLEQISESYDSRIASRMIRGGSVVIDVDCIDYNMRRKAA